MIKMCNSAYSYHNLVKEICQSILSAVATKIVDKVVVMKNIDHARQGGLSVKISQSHYNNAQQDLL